MSSKPIKGYNAQLHIDGLPVIRSGDNVFLLTMPTPSKYFDQRMELMQLSLDHYDCPFSIFGEFDQWFEWHRRLHQCKQHTGHILTSMLSDVKRIKKHKRERKMEFRCQYNSFLQDQKMFEKLLFAKTIRMSP